MEPNLIDESEEKSKVIQASARNAFLVSSSQVDYEAPVLPELSPDEMPIPHHPFKVFVMVEVSVFFLPLQNKRGAGHDEADARVSDMAQQFKRVAAK
jgi:hypothetical protein